MIRSLHGDSVNHPQSVYQMNTGSILMGHPSFGSWLAYGLGSENEDMPAFVVLPDPGGGLKGGPSAWGSGFLPATYQGTTMRPGSTPVLNLKPQAGISETQQRSTLDFLRRMNERHLLQRERRRRIVGADRRLRTRLSHAGRRTGSRRLFARDFRNPFAVRNRSSDNARLRPAMSAGAADGRARRPICADLFRRHQKAGTHIKTLPRTTVSTARKPTNQSPVC